MKLKSIPVNTVIYTSTEEEVTELFTILHENGYKWQSGDDLTNNNVSGWRRYMPNLCFYIEPNKRVTYSSLEYARQEPHTTILTINGLKEQYSNETNPRI